MPKYEAPFSDDARLKFLSRCAATAASDATGNELYVSAAITADLPVFIGKFKQAVEEVAQQRSGRTKETTERETSVNRVQVYVRDFREGLTRRVHRENLPVLVFEKYQLLQDGSFQEPTAYDGWLLWGDKLIAGDAAAVAAGFEAMSNPSATQLAAVLATAKTESDDVAEADRALDDAQQKLADMRVEADALIVDIVDELRFRLRKLDAASQRRIMRTYGVTFRYLPGETPDPDDVPETPAA